ncbi:unnamed protein product [Chrysodeixis includens]|uniref:Uncharacterized protein n=1 Tax=Chrysodeixis includens TaxID=689277 RepID=A0A9N8KXU2_CHRIL|nr:unnamed protein product [Chrysodeixis includens]
MLEELVKDYSAYLKLDVLNGFQTVQDVVDNMLTRLEELTSVLQMVKLKNGDCSSAVTEDISKYRSEITTLSKKIATLILIIQKLHNNVDLLEKQVNKAETDFGISNDNKIKNFLKPFLKRNKENVSSSSLTMPYERLVFESVLDSFEEQTQ